MLEINQEEHAKELITEKAKLSVGEERVRVSFNISNNELVSEIKQKTAELINICEELKSRDIRLSNLAQTSYEEACMWAVKSAT